MQEGHEPAAPAAQPARPPARDRPIPGDHPPHARPAARRTALARRRSVRAAARDGRRADGRGDALRSAVALYTGDLLESCDDEWLLGDRDRLRRRYLDALAELAGVCEAGGEPAVAIALARVSGPPLVGRGPERARLDAMWRSTDAGRAQFVVVSGEPSPGRSGPPADSR